MNLLIVEERELSTEREFTVGGEHAEHIFRKNTCAKACRISCADPGKLF